MVMGDRSSKHDDDLEARMGCLLHVQSLVTGPVFPATEPQLE